MSAGQHQAVPGATCPWDGEPGWPRPRHVPPLADGSPCLPATWVQEDPADPVSANPHRLQRSFSDFRCQVCGERVLDIDSVGWVLRPAANMGGACCTRCMYLAVRSCPRIADAVDDAWELWAVTEPRGYDWHVVDGRTDGHVQADASRGVRHDWQGFLEHRARWRRCAAIG